METKPYVLVCVLCSFERHGWINPGLFETLVMATHDQRFSMEIRCLSQYHRVETARNVAFEMARVGNVDWLIMIDNDQDCRQLTEILYEAETTKGVDIVSVATGINDPGKYALNVNLLRPVKMKGNFGQVDFGGTGVFLIRNNVINAFPKPQDGELVGMYFVWYTDRNVSEDQYFCALAQAMGFNIWTHDSFAEHWHTTSLTKAVVGTRTSWARTGLIAPWA